MRDPNTFGLKILEISSSYFELKDIVGQSIVFSYLAVNLRLRLTFRDRRKCPRQCEPRSSYIGGKLFSVFRSKGTLYLVRNVVDLGKDFFFFMGCPVCCVTDGQARTRRKNGGTEFPSSRHKQRKKILQIVTRVLCTRGTSMRVKDDPSLLRVPHSRSEEVPIRLSYTSGLLPKKGRVPYDDYSYLKISY